MIRDELRGVAPPDQFDDPISYHLWYDANECPWCWGTGFDLELLAESGDDISEDDDDNSDCDCEECNGTGFIPEVHEFLDDSI